MYEAALWSCRQLQAGPVADRPRPLADFSNLTMLRLLIKFEKWEEILDGSQSYLRWREGGFVDSTFTTGTTTATSSGDSSSG